MRDYIIRRLIGLIPILIGVSIAIFIVMQLIPGDVVLTSGIGGVYPKGIRVGTVSEVMTSSGSGVNAIVTPAVDFLHLEEVMVITGGSGEN